MTEDVQIVSNGVPCDMNIENVPSKQWVKNLKITIYYIYQRFLGV